MEKKNGVKNEGVYYGIYIRKWLFKNIKKNISLNGQSKAQTDKWLSLAVVTR